MEIMIYGYCRVSSEEQAADDRGSLLTQERVIRGAAMMRGCEEPVIYRDPGVSGTTPFFSRPAGRELALKLQRGDTLIVAKLDRIFRSMADAVNTAKRFRDEGVALILCDIGHQPVTEGGVGQLQFNVMVAVAEFELWRTRERAADGRAARKAQGGCISGEPPFGYRKVRVGRIHKLEIDDEEQSVLLTMRRLREAGMSLGKIAAHMENSGIVSRSGKPFSKSGVAHLLRTYPETANSDVAQCYEVA